MPSGQATDERAVRAVIAAYLDAVHRGDGDLAASLFMPDAELFGRVDGRIRVARLGHLLDQLAAGPSPEALGEARLVATIEVQVSGTSATARVTTDDLREDFTLGWDGSAWRITTKTFSPRR
jgi:hypothetical protein